MLTDINAMLEYFGGLITAAPWQLTLICAGIHAAAVILCVIMNSGDMSASGAKTSRNTVHTSFWLCVIVMLPFAGILLYLLFSVLPYFIWRKKSDSSGEFPLTFKLGKWRQIFLLTAGVSCSAAQWVLGYMGIALNVSLGAEAAFICWAAAVLYDLYAGFCRRAAFFAFYPVGETVAPVPAEDILGRKHFTESTALFSRSVDKKTVRAAADMIFPEACSGELIIETNFIVNEQTRCEIYSTQREFEKSYADVSEMTYIGGGITRYSVYEWTEGAEGIECLERVVFRAAPKMRYFLIRAAITLFAQAALFSEVFFDFYRSLINYAAEIAGGIGI